MATIWWRLLLRWLRTWPAQPRKYWLRHRRSPRLRGWHLVARSGRQNADSALIAALAAGHTARVAAKACGVSERTVARRQADATFRAAVVEARTDLLRQAVGVLAAKATAAAEGLEQLLAADSEQVRLGACRSLLEFAIK